MKDWRGDLECHVSEWSQKLGSLGWWAKHIFHSTDVQNAANILKSGCIYSRIKAKAQKLMKVDVASPEIISHTRSQYHDYVRLYFRPATPTEFRREGIRPIGQRELNAHCPIPVYFIFNIFDIVLLDATEYSNGNMASSKAEHGSTKSFFFQIPFDLVYHDGPIPPEDDRKEEIIFTRCAEVLVPESLPLEPGLRAIMCRSGAERQTLLNLIDTDSRKMWENKIHLDQHGRIFKRKWTFVEDVVVVDDRVNFLLNPNTITPGPFKVRFIYKEKSSKQPLIREGRFESLRSRLSVDVANASRGIATLYLDDSLAYCAQITFEVIPF